MKSLILFLLCVGLFSTTVFAHMKLSYPPIRAASADNNHHPLPADKEFQPCNGRPREGPGTTIQAGQMLEAVVTGGAPHKGGHCEFSISYNEKDFVSIHKEIRDCFPLDADGMKPGPYKYQISIPNEIPAGEAVFSWTWVNAVGNREFYMNCADIIIESSYEGPLVGPRMVVANLPGHYPSGKPYPHIASMTDNINDEKDGRAYYEDSNREVISIFPPNSASSRSKRQARYLDDTENKPNSTPQGKGTSPYEPPASKPTFPSSPKPPSEPPKPVLPVAPVTSVKPVTPVTPVKPVTPITPIRNENECPTKTMANSGTLNGSVLPKPSANPYAPKPQPKPRKQIKKRKQCRCKRRRC